MGGVGVISVDGKLKAVAASAWVRPRLAVCPMAWSWALFWRKKVHERLTVRAGLAESCRLRDHYPVPL